MAVTTATYASSQGSWTDLGPAAPTIVQNDSQYNVFAFADVMPTDPTTGFRIDPNTLFVMTAAPTGWTATHLWVTGLGGTGNVIVAQ